MGLFVDKGSVGGLQFWGYSPAQSQWLLEQGRSSYMKEISSYEEAQSKYCLGSPADLAAHNRF